MLHKNVWQPAWPISRLQFQGESLSQKTKVETQLRKISVINIGPPYSHVHMGHTYVHVHTNTHIRDRRKGKARWEGLRHSRSMGVEVSQPQLSLLVVTVYRI